MRAHMVRRGLNRWKAGSDQAEEVIPKLAMIRPSKYSKGEVELYMGLRQFSHVQQAMPMLTNLTFRLAKTMSWCPLMDSSTSGTNASRVMFSSAK